MKTLTTITLSILLFANLSFAQEPIDLDPATILGEYTLDVINQMEEGGTVEINLTINECDCSDVMLMTERPITLTDIAIWQAALALGYTVIVDQDVLPSDDMNNAFMPVWPMEGFDIEITPAELVPLIQVFEIKNYQKFTMLGYESDTPFTAGIHESRGSHVTYKLREIDGIVLMESIMPIINISKAEFNKAKKLAKEMS
jgi:hypothetical protein